MQQWFSLVNISAIPYPFFFFFSFAAKKARSVLPLGDFPRDPRGDQEVRTRPRARPQTTQPSPLRSSCLLFSLSFFFPTLHRHLHREDAVGSTSTGIAIGIGIATAGGRLLGAITVLLLLLDDILQGLLARPLGWMDGWMDARSHASKIGMDSDSESPAILSFLTHF